MEPTHETPQAREDLEALHRLTERCTQLGVLLWRYDASGNMVHEPPLDDSVGVWARGDAVRGVIQNALPGLRKDPDLSPVQVAPGVTLVALRDDDRGLVESGLLVAMAFEKGCTQSHGAPPWTPMSDGNFTHALGQFVGHGSPEPSQLKHILRWAWDDLTTTQRDTQSIEEFSGQLLHAYEETQLLYQMGRMMNANAQPYEALTMACEQLRQVLEFGWVAIKLNGHQPLAELSGSLVFSGELPCDIRDFTHECGALLADTTRDNWTRLLNPERHPLARLVNAEVITEPIIHDKQVIGVLMAGNKLGDDNEVSSVETQLVDAIADFLGVFHENLARFEEQRVMFMGTLRALTSAIDAKDPYTHGHSERVSYLSWRLAQRAGLGESELQTVRIAGLVHDVGKIGVPESVLCKAGRLTDEEFAHIKKHPRTGHDILKDIPPMKPMLPGVLHHHERWDGRGYPDGFAGNDIPLLGRIIACADTFDAMSSTRSYRSAMPRDKVLAEIRRSAGTQLDPQLAAMFVMLDFSEYDKMVEGHRGASGVAA
ncbi:MAG: HD domain-containing protein [Phycisphaera sp.]|nr:HD domain-containing protein [Phycisphaera sp.]